MFIVCGEALWDLYASDTADGVAFDGRIGGSPFNVAVGLSKLGVEAALFTGLSTDGLGERLYRALTVEGVDTSLAVRTSRPTTLSLVELGADGSPAYAFYGEGAADRALTAADLPRLADDVWGLHAGSFSLVVEPVSATLEALLGRQAGRRLVTLDPNVRLNAEPDIERWRRRIGAFVAFCDVVKVSLEDLSLLAPDADPADLARTWLADGAAAVVLTKGGEGSEAWGAFGHVEVDAVPVRVNDTVGAGDAFMAATIAKLHDLGVADRAGVEALSARDATEVLSYAVRAGAVACSHRGAHMPRRDEIGSN